jgi:c-di-GMP-binding flagellar brake protein YcgR
VDDDGKREIVEREFVRVPTSIETRLVVVSPDGVIPHDGWVKGEIVEIGGGGARVLMPFEGSVGDAVSVRFIFPDTEEEMTVSGRVVNAWEENGLTKVCIKFVGVSEEETKHLLTYAFREQIREAKRQAMQGPPAAEGKSDED